MVVDADRHRDSLRAQKGDDGATFKMTADPRVTSVGRVLRRLSLDELPQLINVWRGQMSLVGPRPHPLDDVERYDDIATRRLLAKPGMTGLWQVSGRSDLDWDQSVMLDLYYVENWSLPLDSIILLRTLAAVITGRGAY
jgi:lipopolysaccharide/colanic/teichoic acid biosynthesis glycosyltransferase